MPIATPRLNILREHRRPDILFSLCRGEGADDVYCGSSDHGIHHLDPFLEKPEARRLEGHSSYVSGVARTGEFLVSSGWDRKLIWWHPGEGRVIREVKAHRKWLRGVVASPDGKTLATVSDDMTARLWRADDGKLLHELEDHPAETPTGFPSMLFTARFSPDGSLLATADKIGQIRLWDVATGQVKTRLEAPELYTWDGRQRRHSIGGIRSICFSPDGRLLAVSGVGHIHNVDGLGGKARITVFNLESGERHLEYASDRLKGLVQHLQFSPDGSYLLGGGGSQKDGFFIFLDPGKVKTPLIAEQTVPMHVHEFILDTERSRLVAAGHHRLIAGKIEVTPAT